MTDNNTTQMKVTSVYKSMRVFADELNEFAGEEVLADICKDFAIKELAYEVRLELIFRLITANAPEPENVSTLSRHDALDLAEKLGPEWCQWLYRFAVLCTKLA